MSDPIIHFEQINHRGEASRPRVDLDALAELLNRAAVEVNFLTHRLRDAGQIPGDEPRETEKALIAALREVRSVRTRRRRRTPCDRYRR